MMIDSGLEYFVGVIIGATAMGILNMQDGSRKPIWRIVYVAALIGALGMVILGTSDAQDDSFCELIYRSHHVWTEVSPGDWDVDMQCTWQMECDGVPDWIEDTMEQSLIGKTAEGCERVPAGTYLLEPPVTATPDYWATEVAEYAARATAEEEAWRASATQEAEDWESQQAIWDAEETAWANEQATQEAVWDAEATATAQYWRDYDATLEAEAAATDQYWDDWYATAEAEQAAYWLSQTPTPDPMQIDPPDSSGFDLEACTIDVEVTTVPYRERSFNRFVGRPTLWIEPVCEMSGYVSIYAGGELEWAREEGERYTVDGCEIMLVGPGPGRRSVWLQDGRWYNQDVKAWWYYSDCYDDLTSMGWPGDITLLVPGGW